VGAGPFSSAIADLDQDGLLDFATANVTSASVSVVLSDGQALLNQCDRGLAGARVLALEPDHDIVEPDPPPLRFCLHRGGQHRVANMTAGEFARERKLVQLARVHFMAVTEMRAPQRAALLGRGQRKFDHLVETPRKRRIKTAAAVAGQQHDAPVQLDALQQVIGL